MKMQVITIETTLILRIGACYYSQISELTKYEKPKRRCYHYSKNENIYIIIR